MDDVTTDTLPCGTLSVRQFRRGYRVCLDSLLLVAQVAREPTARFLDIGAGSGALAMSLLRWWPTARGVAVERQPSLARLCADNVQRNGLEDAIETRTIDIRDLPTLTPGVDLAIMNPPYFRPGDGRLSPHPERAAARHQLHGDLHALVAAGARHLGPQGRFALVYPSCRIDEAVQALVGVGLGAIEIRHTRPRHELPRTVALICARRSDELLLQPLPDLILHGATTKYASEVQSMLRCP